jgi:uncharacterized membrane protein
VRALSLGLSLAGLLYPVAIYFLIGWVPAGLLLFVPLALIASRLAVSRGTSMLRPFAPILLTVAILTLCLAVFDRPTAIKAYPILMSGGMALAFGRSLLTAPTLIETFASLRGPEITPDARAYMRKVTWAWFLFLSANTCLSALTLASGRLDLWTLYNGLVSYLLMGLLFAGEWLIRQRVRC